MARRSRLVSASVLLIAVAASTIPAMGEESLKPWIEGPVRYISRKEEARDFRKLESEEDRAYFIERFWARRDPTPNSPPNEFKDEHYRRITYANDRWAWDAPGWKSDRGRLYILYGPPDEIESHPSGGTVRRMPSGGQFNSASPFEIWRYRSMEGIGNDIWVEFVDTQRSGEYRLVNWPAALEPKQNR